MDFIVKDSAKKRLEELRRKDIFKKETFFRISIEGGGCSGFQYKFLFDKVKCDDDLTIDLNNELEVVIDETSMDLVKGSELHFQEDMSSSMFVIKNPNAEKSCGCGNSFSI